MNKRGLMGLIILIVIVLLVGAYFLFTNQSSDEETQEQTQNQEKDLDFIQESADLQNSDDTFAAIDDAVELLE